ncbi:hypothetical protein Tco_1037690 [Tanacetum coccineum]
MLTCLLDLLDDNKPSGLWNVKETAKALYTSETWQRRSFCFNIYGVVSHYLGSPGFPGVVAVASEIEEKTILVIDTRGEQRSGTISIDLPRKIYVTEDIEILIKNEELEAIIPKVNERIPISNCSLIIDLHR